MSLTNDDLKSIRKIVHDEVHDQICCEVPAIVEGKILPLKSDIKFIKEKLQQIWKGESEDIIETTNLIEKLQKEIINLKARVKKLELS
jgi:hypothetical protein